MDELRQELAFLFTDIERSTRLVRELEDRYPELLWATREILETAFAAHDGRIVECRGDEVFAVFDSPRCAVSAALEAQRGLQRHRWIDDADVRIRMGIHAGTAIFERSDYVGLDVHRASRISSAAHGGQVLLSAAAAEHADSPTRLLGEYELAGLPGAECLFQVLDPDLPSEFPPLRAARRRDESPVRVVIADDSVLLREGVASVLTDAGLEVVGQAGSAGELIQCIRLIEPDVAVVDIRMPPRRTDDGLRAARVIRRRFPRVGIILLSQLLETAYADEVIQMGPQGVGYLLKDRIADMDEFVAAVRRVAVGESALDAELVSELMRRGDWHRDLTPDERDVLGLVAQGLSDAAIAHRLFLPSQATEARLRAALGKVDIPPEWETERRTLALLERLTNQPFPKSAHPHPAGVAGEHG